MGSQDITRAELLAELFTRIEAASEPEPIPAGWFTIEEYQKAKGLTNDKARRQLYAAHQAGLLGRCQRGRMWYYEKEG